jgi:hypothetical protein
MDLPPQQKSYPGWLREKALAAQEDALKRKETETANNEQKVKEFLADLVKRVMAQELRLKRLAAAFADRCWRVHELMGENRELWERANTAEDKVRELEAKLAEATSVAV